MTKLLLAAAATASMAAAEPRIDRVRAPAGDIGKWFPKGTELISLKPDEFEELVRRAATPRPSADEAFLLRVEHRARWEDGSLVGRSTFTVRRDRRGPVRLLLAPWNLAVEGESPLRSTDDGRVILPLEAEGPAEVVVAWSRAARPHALGRSFVLELPRAPLASLVLDLPDRLVPEGFEPAPGPVATGRALWRKTPGSGAVEVRLRGRGESDGSTRERPWISGPTTIDVGPASAGWRSEWKVESDGMGRSIRVAFSPGLEPADATGPDVESTELARVRDHAEMTIRLRAGPGGASAIRLRGLASVPADRPWPVPTAWPLDAEWLGGDVTVRLDRSRVLAECRVLQGRRLPVAAEAAAEKPTLLFEPERPGTPAVLRFAAEGGGGRRAEVRGSVRYTPAGATLDARLRWTFPSGRPGELAFELPEAWSIERITLDDAPVEWHRDAIGRGQARVRLATPPVDGEATAATVRVRGSNSSGGDDDRDLPRLRPVGTGPAADETWIATASGDRLLVPRRATGLAWLDPGVVAASGAGPDPTGLVRALAWRWSDDGASARVAIVPAPREIFSRVDGTITIAAGRIRADWRMTIRPGALPLASVPLGWSESGPHVAWRRKVGAEPDRDLATRDLSPREREELGLSDAPAAVAVDLAEGDATTIVLEGTSDRPWPGRGPVPLPLLPEGFHARGRVSIRVAPDLIARVDARDLEDSEGDPAPAEPDSAGRPRLDRTLTYDDTTARLAIETVATRPRPGSAPASCRLVTTLDPSGRSLHRLALHFPALAPASLELTLPAGVELLRARRGDAALDVLADGSRRTIPIVGGAGDIVLEYRENAPASPARLRPTVPALSTPCINFVWAVVVPGGRTVGRVGSGLVAVDPTPTVDPAEILGAAWTRTARGVDEVTAEAAEDLQRRWSASTSAKTLGDQLLLLSAGGSPVVVDRIGLQAVGLGPGSSAVTPGSERDATRGGVVVGPLRLIVRDGAIAVTARSSEIAEAIREPATRPAIDEAIRDAARDGESHDARWLAVEKWCEIARRGAIASAPFAGPARNFACNGWPGPEAWVEVVPATGRLLTAALTAAAMIGLGVAARFLPTRRRAAGLVLLTLIAVAGLWPDAPLPDGAGAGLLLGLAAAWLAQPTRRRPAAVGPPASVAPRGGSTIRSATVVAGVFFASALGLTLMPCPASPAEPQPERILAIFPYEGPPDPASTPSRVILRLADYERLKAAAAPSPPARTEALAVSASHQVEIADDRSARVATEFSLDVAGIGPTSWRVPTEGAWDIRATLDGRPCPARIVEAGRAAVVAIQGAGTHRLRFVRTVSTAQVQGGREVDVAIPPVPRADVEVAGRGGGTVVGATRRGTGSPWLLGPAEGLLVLIPGPPGREAPTEPALRALILWDALPAGDRLRLRLTPAGGPMPEVRLAMEEGAQVRVAERSRLIRSDVETKGGGIEWSASFDPPCSREEPVEIEVWRPGGGAGGPRRMPRISLPGGVLSGAIALRRPGDWTGRLDEPGGFGGREEEMFASEWGRLPDDPLTLSGAVTFQGAAEVRLDVRPVVPRPSIRPEIRVELGEGRVDVAAEAVVRDASGGAAGLDVDLPDGFRLDEVRAEGLMGVARPAPGRLHLEMTRVAGPGRTVAIRGHLLVAADAPFAEGRRYRVAAPWPRWPGARVEDGALTIVSAARPSIEPVPGAAPIAPVESSGTLGEDPAPTVRAYTAVAPADVSAIRWGAAPPRIGVFLQSRLVVGEGTADLDTTIRYEVAGGPLDAIYLRLPTAWAGGASVQLVGGTFARASESRGEWTFWTIRPASPIWGSARFNIRSRRPTGPGVALAFPDIVPLGQGRVDKIVAVERTTAAPIELEGSAGLQPADPARMDDGRPGPAASTRVGVYRVTSDKWSLMIRPGGGGEGDATGSDGRAAVRETESICSLRPDGTVVAATSFLVNARPGRPLRFRLGPRAEVISAVAAGRPLPLLSDEPGSWSIPFETAGAFEVHVLWTDAAGGEVVPPRLEGGEAPALVRVAAMPGAIVRSAAVGLEPMGAAAWRAERAERLARRALASIGDFDRSSTAREAELTAVLTRFTLEARIAERSAREATIATGADDRPGRRIDQARRSIAESLDLYGLDDFRSILTDPAAPTGPETAPEPLALGQTSYYRSAAAPAGGAMAIAWARQTVTPPPPRQVSLGWLAPGMIGALVLRAAGVPAFSSRVFGAAIVLGLIGVAMIAPLPGVVLLLAAWAGRG